LDELDSDVAEGDAEGSGDGASDDNGFCGKGEEGRDEEREYRSAVVRVGHGFDCKGSTNGFGVWGKAPGLRPRGERMARTTTDPLRDDNKKGKGDSRSSAFGEG
jgi:hypothetical protein